MSLDNERIEYSKGEYPESITCNVCDRQFIYSREKRTTKHTCRACILNRHRYTLKVKMIAYKGGKCQVCGYAQCTAALDFHHVDPNQKEFIFGGQHNLGAERLRAELDKCVLICSNCHRELHQATEAVEWGWPPAEIVTRVEAAHREWQPPAERPDFSRHDWRDFHPKFTDPGQRLAPQCPPNRTQ